MKTLLEEIIEATRKEQEEINFWKDSRFAKMDELKLDLSGKVGERWLAETAKSFSIPVIYEEKKNLAKRNGTGTFDLQINSKRVEVKTARLGVNTLFQHESLRSTGYDLLSLIDITPHKAFLTFLKYSNFDLRAKHPVFNTKPHLRKGSIDTFKFDLNMKRIEAGIKHGLTIDLDSSTDEIKKFLLDNVS